MNGPKISVIIPLYNHERYIKEAVCSVLEQTFKDFELIIINDGSADGSEEIVRSIQDGRIKYYYQENQGAHNTINRGIKLARGEYVSILNSDDVYYVNRLEECLKIIEADSTIKAAFSHIEIVDDQGKFIRYKKGAEDNWERHNVETSFKGENNIVLDLLAGNFLLTTSNLFCRKSIFQGIGYFRNLRYAHDYDFFLRLCYHSKVHIINTPLLKYRIHSDNTFNVDNEAEIDFEVGLILSIFFMENDLKKVFPDDDIYTNMLKFFNSINTYHSERIIMTLAIFFIKFNSNNENFESLKENSDNFFKRSCIAYYQNYYDVWKESQELWKKWNEINEQIKILENRVKEKDEQISSLLNSRSYRLGRLLTWPVRKL